MAQAMRHLQPPRAQPDIQRALHATESMARAFLAASPLTFDPPAMPSTKYAGLTPSLSANWIKRPALIRLAPFSYFCTC